VTGAADAYQAMRESRPYRPAREAGDAAAELRAEVKRGRLDADAVEAVLGAAGHRVARRREGNHIEHIYAKTGASNRAGAGLFAMQHGLLAVGSER
jgi:HD-GYP domain-containing protein (c-di-GMP phosphodiesterase class II)